MEGFDHKEYGDHSHDTEVAVADPALSMAHSGHSNHHSTGSSVQDSELEKSLNDALSSDSAQPSSTAANDHDHAPQTSQFEFHISLDQVDSAKGLDRKTVDRDNSFKDNVGAKGDYLNPGGGTNVVIGSGDSDVISGTGGGFNTITTGTGKDTIILGQETTNRIFDFDPANDRFALDGLKPKDIIIAQGKNPGKGGLDQPLDSVTSTLIIDKNTEHILASLSFVNSADISERHFVKTSPQAEEKLLRDKKLEFNTQEGDGTLTGTQGRDRLVGGDGDDFLYVGDHGFKFETARGGGGTEFPFRTDSPGTSEVRTELKGGVLHIEGEYQDFDGFPLFSQGEKEIDPNAKILNGSDPKALVEGFLRVPEDVEGNLISGTHLHMSPAGDRRGNFADATVVRFFENNPTDAKSGTISGEFNLTPEEQAALLAGNMYINIHTNIDGDGDGKAGFPTGENRLNLNQDVVRFT